MNNDHYVSLELAKQLKGAGIDFPESERVWVRYKRKGDYQWNPWFICTRIEHLQHIKTQGTPKQHYEILPAPSLMELLDELPKFIDNGDCTQSLRIDMWPELNFRYQSYREQIKYKTKALTAPDAAALMLLKARKAAG